MRTCCLPCRPTARKHCKEIKKRIPNAKTVFIGPCVAKKDEAQRYEGLVDAVLTFDELSAWLKSKNIVPEKKLDHDDNSKARFFPTTGGILKTMAMENQEYTYMAIDGTKNCIMTLKEIEEGNVHHAFIEMSACIGSCIGGPVMEKFHAAPVKDYAAVARYAGKKDFILIACTLTGYKVVVGLQEFLPATIDSLMKGTVILAEAAFSISKRAFNDEVIAL